VAGALLVKLARANPSDAERRLALLKWRSYYFETRRANPSDAERRLALVVTRSILQLDAVQIPLMPKGV